MSDEDPKAKPTLEERVSKTKAEIKHMRRELEEVERLHGRFMDSIINPPIITKPADDLDMTPGSVHSVGEPEPEPVSWWKRWWGETVLRTQSWVFDVIFLTAYGFAFFALGRLTA